MKAKTIILSALGLIAGGAGAFIIASFNSRLAEGATQEDQRFFAYCLGGFFILTGLVIIGLAIYDGVFNSSLDKNGIFTTGEIVRTNKDSSGITYAYIRFTDENGNEQFIEDCFFSGVHRPGDKVEIKYVLKKNGKVSGQALDRG